MDSDDEIFKSKRADRLFVGSRFQSRNYFTGERKPMRIASEIVPEDDWRYATIRDEVVLQNARLGRFELKATFSEDDRKVGTLVIQRWDYQKDRPRKVSFSFQGSEITRLLDFVERVRTIHLDGPGRVNEAIADLTLSSSPRSRRRPS